MQHYPPESGFGAVRAAAPPFVPRTGLGLSVVAAVWTPDNRFVKLALGEWPPSDDIVWAVS